MLIQTPRKKKWERDSVVDEFIEHFDRRREDWQRNYKDKCTIWDFITASEFVQISEEAKRCQEDFSYAARNYFWIIDRDTKQDKLLKLWESQELILNDIMSLRARGLSQKVVICKSRQLGCSTLIDSLIAWRSMFFTNTNSIIVSYDDGHAAYLFGLVLNIYDKLPWFLKPMCASREFKKGLLFDNPNEKEKYDNPGLNSRITCKGANAITSVGRGERLSAVHISEAALFNPESKAREIIESDLRSALADSPETMGIIETTPNGAGTYFHSFWLRMEAMGERADWQTRFLPWFFDRSHRVYSLPNGWQAKQEEEDIRERAKRDWVRCDNKLCLQFYPSVYSGKHQSEEKCISCGVGTLHEYVIADDQLAWMEHRRLNCGDDEKSQNVLAQEQASTAEDSFRISGIRLFSTKAVAYAQKCIQNAKAAGYIDKSLNFHGVNMDTGRCWLPGCEMKHDYDEKALEIWEFPQKHANYVVAADVADGLGGDYDYSVVQVIWINPFAGEDKQVACFSSNTMSAEAFADRCNIISRYYNDALFACELNTAAGGVCSHAMRFKYQYPNMYRPLNQSSINLESSLIGWRTTPHSKASLYHAMRRALDNRILEIRDKFTVVELHNFRRDEDSKVSMSASVGHDDRIMALMIAYFAAHERDWDEDCGMMRTQEALTVDNAPYIYSCNECRIIWPGRGPSEHSHCPKCFTMCIEIEQNMKTESTYRPDEQKEDLDYFSFCDEGQTSDYFANS